MDKTPVTIITPCYNENITVIKFLEDLEPVLAGLPQDFRVVVVDDCSFDNTLPLLQGFSFKAPNVGLKILHLKFNVGHQAAIYQGLLYAGRFPGNEYIVMDSDGEDAPSVIPELLQFVGTDMVHVIRGKRQEGVAFKISYRIYKLIFRLVTGKDMNYGNYCLISRKILDSAVFHTFTHFAAFLSRQKGTRTSLVAERGRRLDGKSKMSFKNLLSHAFKSFVEYGEDLLMIFLKSFILIMVLFLAAISNVIYQKFVANTAILGWTSIVAIGLLNLAIISIGFFVLGILLLNLSHQKNNNNKTGIYMEATETGLVHEQ
jgi:glycosyltransferase involved in cell wall biosynthesis